GCILRPRLTRNGKRSSTRRRANYWFVRRISSGVGRADSPANPLRLRPDRNLETLDPLLDLAHEARCAGAIHYPVIEGERKRDHLHGLSPLSVRRNFIVRAPHEESADRWRHDDRSAGPHPKCTQAADHEWSVHGIDSSAAGRFHRFVVSLHK